MEKYPRNIHHFHSSISGNVCIFLKQKTQKIDFPTLLFPFSYYPCGILSNLDKRGRYKDNPEFFPKVIFHVI